MHEGCRRVSGTAHWVRRGDGAHTLGVQGNGARVTRGAGGMGAPCTGDTGRVGAPCIGGAGRIGCM